MLTYLRCSAGGNEGWGNLFRILIIREHLIKNFKSKVKVIINSNSKVKNFLKKKKIDFICLYKKNFNYEKKKISRIKDCDLSVIEMLNPKEKIQKLYMSKSKKLIVLDDVLDNRYYCNLLFSCQNTQKKPFISKKTLFFSGYKFFPLREEFNKFIKKKKKMINKKIKKITVFLGGSSYEKITYKVAKKLKNYNRTNFILGGELNIEFKKKIMKINKSFSVIKLPKNIAEILYKSDLVISGGGYAKIETACVGTPQISIAVHQHQIDLLKNFSKKFNLKFITEKNLDDLNGIIENFSFKKRSFVSKKYKHFFLRNGIEEISKKINNV